MPDNWAQETQGVCIDGVNSSIRPDLIGMNQLAWLVNGTVRDGKARTRIALKQKVALPSGKVQGAGFYSIMGGMLVVSIGGQLHRVLIAGNKFTVEQVALGFNNSGVLDNTWMVETPSGFIIQDNQSAPIVYNGSITERSNPDNKEIPIGSAMAYGNGRLWVVKRGQRNLVAGDIYQGSPGSELFFTETQYLQGGGAFYFPYDLTGLAFLPVNNTTTGYGSLMVFGARSLVSLRAEVTERDLWQVIPGFQTIVLDGIGTPSHHSITRVDQDLYWRDETGQIRSLRSAAQEAQGPGNTGLSREVERIIDYETKNWLRLCSGVYVNNRLLFTGAPLIGTGLPHNIVFQKLISLDCAPLATMRGKAQPAYDGEWTGTQIVRVVQGTFRGVKRAFAIVRNGTENSLWEFDEASREDSYISGAADVSVRILSSAEYRRFDFGSPSKPKQLTRCDVYPSQIEGEVDVSVYWRVGNRNQWQLWGSFSACAKMTDPAGASDGPTDNIIFEPSDYSNSDWAKTNVTVAGAAGAQNVNEVVTGSGAVHSLQQPFFCVIGRTYKATAWVKKFNTRNRVKLYVYDGPIGSSNGIVGTFRLNDGSSDFTTEGGVINGNITMTDEGSGWWQITVEALFPADSRTAFTRLAFANDSDSTIYIGSTSEGFYIKNYTLTDFQPSYPPHQFKNLRSQERGRVKSLSIPSIEDPIMELAQSAGYTFQVRLVWRGNVTIDRIDVFARAVQDKSFSDVFDLPVSCVQNTVEDNELVYTIVP